jgi:hypothetical protein
MGYLKLDSGMGGLAISRLDQPASKCTYYMGHQGFIAVAYINEHCLSTIYIGTLL